MPVNKVNYLAISEQGHRRTARLIFPEVLPRSCGSLEVLAGKYRYDLLWYHRMLEREGESGTCIARRATTHRIDKNQHGSPLVSQGGVNLGGVSKLLHAQSSDLGPHGSHQGRIVWHSGNILTV
jgi:hypothetical protein